VLRLGTDLAASSRRTRRGRFLGERAPPTLRPRIDTCPLELACDGACADAVVGRDRREGLTAGVALRRLGYLLIGQLPEAWPAWDPVPLQVLHHGRAMKTELVGQLLHRRALDVHDEKCGDLVGSQPALLLARRGDYRLVGVIVWLSKQPFKGWCQIVFRE